MLFMVFFKKLLKHRYFCIWMRRWNRFDKALIAINMPRLILFLFIYFIETIRTYYTFVIRILNCFTKFRCAFWALFFCITIPYLYHVEMRWLTSCFVDFIIRTMTSQVRQNFNQACEAAINRQINTELNASYVYLSMVSLAWVNVPIHQTNGVCLNCGDVVFIRNHAIKQRFKFHLCWAEGSSCALGKRVHTISRPHPLCLLSCSDNNLGCCEWLHDVLLFIKKLVDF